MPVKVKILSEFICEELELKKTKKKQLNLKKKIKVISFKTKQKKTI